MSISAYKSVSLQSDVHSASPHRLIQMLYEGAIGKIYSAKGAIERKRLDEKSENISKAVAIITELECSLNTEKGGELADNLSALYDYMRRTLLAASGTNNVEKLDEIANQLLELKEAWDQIGVEHHHVSGGRVERSLDQLGDNEEADL